MKIADKTVVSIDYTLKNAAGEVVDSSNGAEPLSYIHGAQQIVPGLERELTGLAVGEKKEVVVHPQDGYGSVDPEGVFSVPRAAFPPDAKLTVGDAFVGEDDEGRAVPVRIVELKPDSITVDANHPLAGETLYFSVEVKSVRAATEEDMAHADHDHPPGQHPVSAP